MKTKAGVPILKGPGFIAKLRQIACDPLPVDPWPDLKYRNILIPGMVGGEVHFARAGIIGQGLRMRGATVTSLQCDQFLPACTMRKVDHYESACTRWCHKNSGPFAETMGLPYRWYSEFITAAERRECDRIAADIDLHTLHAFEHRGVPIGEHVRQSIESFYKIGYFDPDDPETLPMVRHFVRAALYMTTVGFRAIDQLKIDKVVEEDGKKIDWGVIRGVAARMGIPVDVIRSGLGHYSIRFELDRPPNRSAMMSEWETWRHIPLTPEQDKALEQYMLRRERVPYEYRSVDWQTNTTDLQEARQHAGLPDHIGGKVFGMFPNLSYDADRNKTIAAFDSANEWITETIRFFHHWPRHHLIVKIHPSEKLWKARDPLVPQIERQFPSLPPNIHLLPPESDVSAHAVARLCDWALVYTSTVAAEAAALGKHVMLVGGGWNAGRGFSHDVTSVQDYFDKLEGICSGTWNPEFQTDIARRYAYALFFRSNIRISWFTVLDLNVRSINIRNLAELAPGRDASMDAICRSILCDEPCEDPSWRDLGECVQT